MRYAQIENGLVVNIIESSPEYAAARDLVAAEAAGIGDAFFGGVFVPAAAPVQPMQEAKVNKTAAVKLRRDLLETQGFMHLGKLFDSDERSVARITAAALTAQVIGASFAINWTAADNSVVALDQAGMLGMPAALAMRANALHQHAAALKAQITEAADATALAVININAGWPTP